MAKIVQSNKEKPLEGNGMPKYYNLPEYDERSLIDFNKKMAEEAKNLQEKGNNGPVPGL